MLVFEMGQKGAQKEQIFTLQMVFLSVSVADAVDYETLIDKFT